MHRPTRFRIEVGKPAIDEARLQLFHAWQRDRVDARGWESSHLSLQDYFMRFAFPTSVAREIAYYDDAADGRLVMLSICDETPQKSQAEKTEQPQQSPPKCQSQGPTEYKST